MTPGANALAGQTPITFSESQDFAPKSKDHGLHQGEASWGGDDPHSRLEEPKAGGMSGQRHTVWGWGVEKGREVGGGSRVDR